MIGDNSLMEPTDPEALYLHLLGLAVSLEQTAVRLRVEIPCYKAGELEAHYAKKYLESVEKSIVENSCRLEEMSKAMSRAKAFEE